MSVGPTFRERLQKIRRLSQKLKDGLQQDVDEGLRGSEVHLPLSELLLEEIDELQSSIMMHERASTTD